MQLKKLTTKNFMGDNSKIEFNGDMTIAGDNGLGKTRKFHAYVWLLFGKNSNYDSPQKFDLKPLDEDGNVIHKQPVEVLAEFDTGLKLKRIYKEVWKKDKLDSHTTDYYINDMEFSVKKKEFDKEVSEIISEDLFKILSDPLFFNEQLHWKERREILMNLADIDIEKILADNEEFQQLEHTEPDKLERYISKLKSKIKDIEDRNSNNQNSIKTLKEQLPDLKPDDWEKSNLRNEIETLQDKRAEIKKIIKQIGTGEKSELEKKLDNLRQAKQNLIDKHNQKAQIELDKIKNNIDYKRDEISNQKDTILEISNRIDRDTEYIQDRQQELENLRDEYRKLNKKEISDRCPTCKQKLKGDAKEKLFKNFKRDKNKKLKELKEKGSKISTDIEKTENLLGSKRRKLKTQKKKLKQMEDKLESLQVSYRSIKANGLNSDRDEELENLKKQVKKVEKKLEDRQSKRSLDSLENKLEETNSKIEKFEYEVKRLEKIEEMEKSISKYEKKMVENSSKQDKFEHQKELALQLQREIVRQKQAKINELFEFAEFKLFHLTMKDNNIKDTCETIYHGVPYQSLSTSERITIGLDIIRTLSDYYNKYLPIWVDNAESITQIPDMNTQIIKLKVDENLDEIKYISEHGKKGENNE